MVQLVDLLRLAASVWTLGIYSLLAILFTQQDSFLHTVCCSVWLLSRTRLADKNSMDVHD